jgi:hypothetical protein
VKIRWKDKISLHKWVPPPSPPLPLTLDHLGAKEKGEIIKPLVKSLN